MTLPRHIRNYPNWFNSTSHFWSVTKALSIRQEIIDQIVKYHQVLEPFVNERAVWDNEAQQSFSNQVKPGSTSAWAREPKTVFNLLGSAWVTNRSRIEFTDVGWELLRSPNPLGLLEHQVRKYQIGNPQLRNNLTGTTYVIPHYVLLDFLLHSYPEPITKAEFILFIMKVRDHSEIPDYRNFLDSYRNLSTSQLTKFDRSIDSGIYEKLDRVASYAIRFLTLTNYLNYHAGQLSVSEHDNAKRVWAWYEQGNSTHITFTSEKDWFSHYGGLETTPNPLLAADYYRKIGDTEKAVEAYRVAIQKGMAPVNDSAEEYRCRISGEAAIETWLVDHLERIESGLIPFQIDEAA